MSQQRALFRFNQISRPIALDGCTYLIEPINERLHGWDIAPWRPSDANDGPKPVITVTRRGDDFVLTGDSIEGEELYGSTVNIVCAFMAELIMAYGSVAPELLLLHAGGAEVDGKLIVYPAKGKTGKSTLTAQLARHGARIFSDDVVPINLITGFGRALGIEPRMRLPLPDQLAPETSAWLKNHMTLSGKRMGYIGLPRRGASALAPLGEDRPVGAFIQLTRVPDAKPELLPCPRTEIMQLLVRQNFGTGLPALEMVTRFKALLDRTPCYRLRYGDGEAAEALLDIPALCDIAAAR